jgi:hypothetical protein
VKRGEKLSIFLERFPLPVKLFILISGALIFFLLFPFLLQRSLSNCLYFVPILVLLGILYRLIQGKRAFRLIMWLWAGGFIIYMVISLFLILKNVQPLPYRTMDSAELIIYYLSYPLRVLGIFFTGLLFSSITSPIDFLPWGKIGQKIALAFRSFEYSVNAFEENRRALIIQGEWPDFRKGEGGIRGPWMFAKSAPVLVATTFRNIILWFPWAWICYNALQKYMDRRKSL